MAAAREVELAEMLRSGAYYAVRRSGEAGWRMVCSHLPMTKVLASLAPLGMAADEIRLVCRYYGSKVSGELTYIPDMVAEFSLPHFCRVKVDGFLTKLSGAGGRSMNLRN